jgi:hypothetical protein
MNKTTTYLGLKRDYVAIQYLLDILTSVNELTKFKKTPNLQLNPLNISSHSKQSISITEFSNYIKDSLFNNNLTKMDNSLCINEIFDTKTYDLLNHNSVKHTEFDLNFKQNSSKKNNNNTKIEGNSFDSSNSSTSLLEIRNICNQTNENVKKYEIQNRKNEINLLKSKILSKNNDWINDLIMNIYENNFNEAKKIISDSSSLNHYNDSIVKISKDQFLNTSKYCKKKVKMVNKGVLLSSTKDIRSKSYSINCPQNLKRSCSLNADDRISRIIIGEEGILNILFDKFPFIYTSPETIHYLWKTHLKQNEILSKKQYDIEKKYICDAEKKICLNESISKSTEKYKNCKILNEEYNKLTAFINILRNDAKHRERIEDMKKLRILENRIKGEQRAQRFQNARSKRNYEELCLKKKARMLQHSLSEELVLKALFDDIYKIQKQRLIELERYAKEKNEIYNQEQSNNLQSIQNYYKRRFDILNEKVNTANIEKTLIEKCEHKNLNRSKLNYKRILLSNILDLQQQMFRDNDNLYWRNVDAAKFKMQIQNANYI